MIRKFKTNSLSSSSSLSTTAYNSLASSTDSSSPSTSSSSPLPTALTTRCRGLDLLVKAIHQVTAGSVIGVPYIQKRVIRRRSRRRAAALRFDSSSSSMVMLTELLKKQPSKDEKDEQVTGNEVDSLLKRHRRVMAFPSKYQDSVLQSWKPKTRNGSKGG